MAIAIALNLCLHLYDFLIALICFLFSIVIILTNPKNLLLSRNSDIYKYLSGGKNENCRLSNKEKGKELIPKMN